MRTAQLLGVTSAVVVGLLSNTPSRAEIIVDWGITNYVSANANFSGTPVPDTTQNFGGDGGINDSRLTQAFSTSAVLSPTNSYTVPTGMSGAFYGGFEATWFDTNSTVTLSRRQINQSGNADRIAYGIDANPAAAGGELAIVVLFQKANFLNGAAAETVAFDTGTTLTIDTSSLTRMEGRYVVGQGGSYYVSSNLFAAGFTTYTLTTPSSSLWALYDPTAGLNFDQSSAVFSNVTFGDVTSAGFYFENDALTGSDTAAIFVTGFAVDVIPEPSALALLIAATGFLALVARRRR
jgi:hypothetical protein